MTDILQMFSEGAEGNGASASECASEAESSSAEAAEASVNEEAAEKRSSEDCDSSQNASDEDVKQEESSSEDVMKAVRAYLRDKTRKEIGAYFENEEAKLREIYPSFSMESELKRSSEFRQLIKAGVSVRRAYEAVNLEKIMGQALKYAVMTAGKRTADIMKSSSRVAENSLSDTASSVKRTDVNNLTEKEIHKILSEVSKGAKIRF